MKSLKNERYEFVPNTFNFDKVKLLGINEENFLALQIKYKQLFERFIISKLDFSNILSQLKEKKYPIVNDKKYNFYRKYSLLDNDYIYLRNNIHIENLTIDEIKELASENVGIDFIKKTYSKVLFEDGDYVFLGQPSDESKVLSQSIMFELAIDYADLEDLDLIAQLENIVKSFKDNTTQYGKDISKLLGVPNMAVSVRFYDAMPEYFMDSFFDESYEIEENFPPGTVLNANIDYEEGIKLYNEYVEREEMPNGEVYETVYYDKFWNIVPKEESVTSSRFKISEKTK